MEQTVSACLEATLSPERDTRVQAESQLEALRSPQNDPAGQLGIALVNLLLSQSVAIHHRQSAGIALRKFFTYRWSPYFDDFAGAPAAEPEVKDHIRRALLQGLSDPSRKVRLASSHAISTIAGPDYPDQYSELLPCLKELLQRGEPNGLHGAMALLCEFVKVEMDEIQLMHVAQEILPVLAGVLSDANRHNAHIRARCVLVFRQCLTTLFMVKESYPDVVKQASQTMLPQWLSAMHTMLNQNIVQELASGAQGWEALALRNEIFKTLKVAALFRTQFKTHRTDFIQASISTLLALLPVFQEYHLSNASDADAPPTPEGDDDVSCDIPSLASSIFDFISDASRGDRSRELFVQGGTGGQGTETNLLSQLIQLLFVYIGMTTEDEESWANDANAFIADEDDETLAFSLRIAGADLLGALIDDFPGPSLRCMNEAFRARVEQGNAAKARGDEDWWKAHEASLAAIGNNADAISEILETQSGSPAALDIEAIFTNVVLPNIGNDAPPFLQGRCFVFASQFALALPSHLAVSFLDAAVTAIEAGVTSMPVKISAVRTIRNFFRHLPANTVAPHANRIVHNLGPLLTLASEDTLILVIETIQSVIVDDEHGRDSTSTVVDPQVIGEIVQAVLHVWAQNAKDIILLSVVSDLLESLAGSKQANVSSIVVQKSMPVLAVAIGSSLQDVDSDEPSAMAETAVELSKAVLDGAAAASLRGVVNVLCPTLIKVLKTSDDRDVLQNGIECLTVLVKKCPDELFAWREPDSMISAIEAMLHIIARLLMPTDGSESGGLAVGDLVVAILRKASKQIEAILPELLKAMVQRLATAETTSFIQSLILPIAYLMQQDDNQAKQVMDLLDSQAHADTTGLVILAQKWVENAETFQGFWAQRISSLALAKMLDSRRSFLTNTTVRGDILPDNSGIIRTRSRAKTMPHQFTQVPLFAKVAKVLLKEYESATRGAPINSSARDGAKTPETDDEDGDWDDDEPAKRGGAGEFDFLSDMLGPGGLDALQDDDLATEDESDLRDDPVYNMDFKGWLAGYFQHVSQTSSEVLAYLSPHLNQTEAQSLQEILS